MKELLLKAVSSGVVAGIASKVLFADAGDVQLFNMSIDAGLATGAAVGVGSIASDALSENIIEKMNLPQNIISLEEKIVRFGISGAASAGVLLVGANLPMNNAFKVIALGGLSKYGGDYAYDQLLSPQNGILPF